jgi:hypothetical protein
MPAAEHSSFRLNLQDETWQAPTRACIPAMPPFDEAFMNVSQQGSSFPIVTPYVWHVPSALYEHSMASHSRTRGVSWFIGELLSRKRASSINDFPRSLFGEETAVSSRPGASDRL